MGKHLQNFGEFSLEDIFDNICEDKVEFKVGEEIYFVKMNSQRYVLFKQNSSCVVCGLKGKKFILQGSSPQSPHFNLYAVENQTLILMTKDHVVPKSKGGKDVPENYQTCCSICNEIKNNFEIDYDKVRELRIVYNNLKMLHHKEKIKRCHEMARSLEKFMSSLIVEVCQIEKIENHPQADRLEIAHIKGWRTVIIKDQFKLGEKVVYIPPDCAIPIEVSDKWNVTKYLASIKEEDAIVGGRVKVARLRGEASYGFLVAPEQDWDVGTDVAEYFGITKWEPPISSTDGDAEREYPAFHRYFDLENINNFPDLFQDEEIVEITEKIHGCNARCALIKVPDERGNLTFEFMAGSHDVRRKEMATLNKKKTNPETGEEEIFQIQKKSRFWEIFDIPGIKDLLQHISCGLNNVVVFGEIFGSGVQDLEYGHKRGKWDFRVFDITVNGNYLDAEVRNQYCQQFGVQTVPVLYFGPFSKAKVAEFVSGNSTICNKQIREGIVVKTAKERVASTEKKFFNRVALKAISFDYLERKGGTEFH